jgi:hypothetical protein
MMFGLTPAALVARIAPYALIVTAVLGGWLYVSGLRHQVASQTTVIMGQKVALDAMTRNVAALQKADLQRATDMATIAGNQKDRDNAIASAPASAPGAATVALNCVRWHAQHAGTAAPAACRGFEARD